MVRRKKIGLVYAYNSNWIGGTYYIENIIKAVQFLPEEERPELTIFYRDDISLQQVKNIQIDFVKYIKIIPLSRNIVARIINRLSRVILNKNIIVPVYTESLPDSVYPYMDDFSVIKNKVFWIADFQDHYLPEMFSSKEIKERRQYQISIAKTSHKIVFSSQSTMRDYKKFYPNNLNDCRVLNFACVQPNYNTIDIESVKEKFLISKPYFFAPNQFWKHKNHKVIFEALNKIKQEYGRIDFCIVFTGKEVDYRNADYFNSLKNLVNEYKLTDEVKFLGFIDRLEQLQLMNNALAVLQPSLFEGWSTVVEDAKSMSQYLILSDIEVHREQVTENCLFFNPHDCSHLADHMINIGKKGVQRKKIEYNNNVLKFANDFVNIFE